MKESGIDGDYLAHASDDDLAVVFEECGLTKLQQSLLKQKLRKRHGRPPPRRRAAAEALEPQAPTPPAKGGEAPLRVRVTCPADGHAGKPITVQIPDGRKARAAIPDGCAPGRRLRSSCPRWRRLRPPRQRDVPARQTAGFSAHGQSAVGPDDSGDGAPTPGPGRSFTVVAPAGAGGACCDSGPRRASRFVVGVAGPLRRRRLRPAQSAKKFAKEVAKDRRVGPGEGVARRSWRPSCRATPWPTRRGFCWACRIPPPPPGRQFGKAKVLPITGIRAGAKTH